MRRRGARGGGFSSEKGTQNMERNLLGEKPVEAQERRNREETARKMRLLIDLRMRPQQGIGGDF